jgi:plastocyanin
MRAAIAGVIALLVLAVPAAADQTLKAAKGKRYAASDVTIAQGERLILANGDDVQHDVTSTQDRDGRPLFASPLVDPKGQAAVEGTQYLTTGDYPFLCSIHPSMQGTLHVSADGTPASRDGGGAAAVKAGGGSLASVKRLGRLSARVTGAAGADAIVSATATLRGKKVKLAKTRVTLGSAAAQKVALKLTSAARKALKGASRVTVTFKVTVLAPAGAASASTKRTYR